MHLLPNLATPADLFRKAEADLVALEADPANARLAFNLFVTIEHLPDWLRMRTSVRGKAELRIVSHIANGSKHFTLGDPGKPPRHKSVDGTSTINAYADDYADDTFEERLTIHLSIDEERFVGEDRIDAVALGRRALDFWRPHVPGL